MADEKQMAEEKLIDFVSSCNLDIFETIMLMLPVDILWRFAAVPAWRELLVSEIFWKTYCVRRDWDYKKYLLKQEKKEKKAEKKALKKGYRKRKTYLAFVSATCGPVRLFARRKFLKLSRKLMFAQANPGALTAMKNHELRRSFGSNVMGFLDHVLNLDPTFAPALNKRALLLFEEDKYEEAVKDLELAVAKFPYFSDAINNLGLACHEIGELERALELYSKALALEGDSVTYNNRGLCYNDMGKNDAAVKDFTTILEVLNPRYVDAYNNRAYSYNCMEEYEKAISDCESALKLKPKLAEARRIRSYAFLRTGKYVEAIEESSHAIELFGSFYAKAFYTRGLAFEKLAEETGDSDVVREYLERAKADKEVALKFCPDVAEAL